MGAPPPKNLRSRLRTKKVKNKNPEIEPDVEVVDKDEIEDEPPDLRPLVE